MAPRTRPPATTERRVFLREGVTAASATRGLASAAAVPATTAAESFSTLELLGRGRGWTDGSEKYSQLCQLAEIATGVGAEDRARPTRRVLRRSLIASTGASTWYTHGKDRDDRPDTFRDESSNATTRSRARSLVVVQSPLTHKLELIRRIINRSASGDPLLARDSPGDSLHGHSLHRLDTLDCGLERGRAG